MFKIFLAWLFLLVQVCTPAYATVTRTIAADQIRGMESVKNYITNAYGEKSTKGWTVSKNTVAAAAPDSGFVTTGLSNSFAVSATTPIAGDKSFLFTLAAQGDQVCTPITLDSGHKYKVIQGSIEYAVASGTFADDAASVWVYDVTNTTWIQPAPYLLKNHSLPSETLPFEFQATSSTSYKVCIHQAAASTAALRIDNVFVGKRAKAYGSPTTDYVSVTMGSTGFTGGSRTTTATMARVGDVAHFKVKILFNTVFTGGTAYIDLPSGMAIDTSKIPYSTGEVIPGARVTLKDVGTGSFDGVLEMTSSTRVSMYSLLVSGTYALAGTLTTTTPFTWANNDFIDIEFAVPILGWSSSSIMSSDADTRVIAAVYEISSSTANSSIADGAIEILDYDVKRLDTHNAVTTGASWKFTAPVTGRYRVSAHSAVTSITNLNSSILLLYKEGSQYAYLDTRASDYNTTGSTQVELNAGQYLDVRMFVDTTDSTARTLTTTANRYQVSIERISGPAQIAASEKVYLQYTNNASTVLTGGTTKIDFSTKVIDTHTAWDGDEFTAPRADWYCFNGSILLTATVIQDISSYIDGASQQIAGAEVTADNVHMFAGCRYLLAGQKLSFIANTNATLSNSAIYHVLSISAGGN